MTNAEYIIGALTDFVSTSGELGRELEIPTFDDGGATEEFVIHYHINCPHKAGSHEGLCNGVGGVPARDMCVTCKMDWLLQEVEG